jgi:hypothetical protein
MGCLGFAVFVVLLVAIPLLAGKPKTDEQAASSEPEKPASTSLPPSPPRPLFGSIEELERRAPALAAARGDQSFNPARWYVHYSRKLADPAFVEDTLTVGGWSVGVINDVQGMVKFHGQPDIEVVMRLAGDHVEAVTMASKAERAAVEALVRRVASGSEFKGKLVVGEVEVLCSRHELPAKQWMMLLSAMPVKGAK